MDQAFKGLYKKEWRMMRGFFIGMFVIVILIILIFSNLSSDGTTVTTIIEMNMFSIAIIPLTVLYSLNSEAIQLVSFLHNPQSIHKLLLVKLMNGLLFAVNYVFILSFIVMVLNLIQGSGFSFVASMNLTGLKLIVVSIYPTIVLLFFWTLHQWWKKYMKGLSFVFVFILFMITSQAIFFKENVVYNVLLAIFLYFISTYLLDRKVEV